MSNIHIAIVKFYDKKKEFGYIISNSDNDIRFSKDNLSDRNYIPIQDSVVFYTKVNRKLLISKPSDKLNAPWNEILLYANKSFSVYNDKSEQSVNILEPLLKGITNEEIQNLLSSIRNIISGKTISEEDKDKILIGPTMEILFTKVLSLSGSSIITHRCEDNILFLLDSICKRLIVSQNGFNNFINEVEQAFIYPDWKNIVLCHIVKTVSFEIDALDENEFKLSPIVDHTFIDFFLSKCLTQEYCLSLSKESGEQFFSVLDKLFDYLIKNNDFKRVSSILCSCSDPIPEEWCYKTINMLNALLIDEPGKIFGYIKDLCFYDNDKSSCFKKINSGCHNPEFYFFKAIYFAIAVVKKDISIIQDTPYFIEDIKDFLCSLSPKELLVLSPYLMQGDAIFNSQFLKHIHNELKVDDIFRIPLDGESLFGILLDLPEAQDIIGSIMSKDDKAVRLAVKYYYRFSDIVKESYISIFNNKEHQANLLLSHDDDGISIADVLSQDQYYINMPKPKIRSKMLIDGYVEQYLELKKKGIIDEISYTCIKSAIEKGDNPQAQLEILNLFGLTNEELLKLWVLDKEVPKSSIKELLHATIFESIINDIRNRIVIFDIEGDKDKGLGWEFAYKQNDNVYYEKALNGKLLLNETQWGKLENAITSSSIIVGHNIREWDYKLLKKRNPSFGKDSEYLKNTWDTIEIEILLNPSRPSFALNAENGHIANNDVLATERLFMQQLYMLLKSIKNYKKVKKYLPTAIISIIDNHSDIIYSGRNFSKHCINEHNQLFYKPAYQDIPDIEKPKSGNLLIVAEEDSWQTIFCKFNNFNVTFYSNRALDEYNTLNTERMLQHYSRRESIFERALYDIADDCKKYKKKINIKAIPGIIRHAISDKDLLQFVSHEKNPSIICINPEKINDFGCDICFNNVFVLCNSLIPRSSYINNSDKILDIIEKQSKYSIYRKTFPISPDSISILGIEAEPHKEYWISQPIPGEFFVLSRLSKKSIVKVLKEKYPQALLGGMDINDYEEDFDESSQIPEDNENSTFSAGKYWASKLELFNKIPTQTPKILIVYTHKQAESAQKYLNIPYARKDNIRKVFDQALEQQHNVITVIQDLLDCQIYDFESPFSFIFIDKSLLSKQGNGRCFELVREQLNKRLSLFGHGSQIKFLDDCSIPDDATDEQIAKAEECFGKKDNKILTDEDITPLLGWIKDKFRIQEFRGLQESAIKKVIEYKGSQRNFLTILPTGGGKSVIFQGPILFKAIEKGSKKLSLVITPLQALMEDQVKDLIDKGFDSSLIACINANTPSEEKKRIINNIRKHKVCLLYISPERLMNRVFFHRVIQTAALYQGIDSIIFDEAHCITAWGMDFRSDYILALRKCLELQKNYKGITIQMFTATLPWQSKEDLKAEIQFGKNDCNILPALNSEEYNNSLCPIRDHIELQINKIDAGKEESNITKLQYILNNLDENAIDNLTSGRSRMIVFTYSRSDAEESAEWLKGQIQSEHLRERINFFHARIERHEKERRIRQFKDGQILILCSTKAFGLGMNIPNIHYLFHLTPPTFIEDYLQEVGRAARKTDKDEYAPYMEAFPIVNEKREPVKAICYYTQSDIENRLERIQRLYWDDVHECFECIKAYVSKFNNNPKGHYIIPVDLLASKERTDSESKNLSHNEDIVEKFLQCLGWLSRPEGLNRIELGFRCPDSYDLGFNSNIGGISEGSQLGKLIKEIKNKHIIKEDYSRIILQANSIIGNPDLSIDSVEDLESIIDDGVRLGVFNREYMHISISLKNKKYLKDFIGGYTDKIDILSKLCSALNIKNTDINGFDLDQFLDESLKDCNSETKKKYFITVIKESWKFFIQLNQIYTTEEIESNCLSLIRAISGTTAESVSWSILENSIDAKNDRDKLKLFLLATSELSLTTKGSADTDFIEISILDNRELDENEDKDSKAKKELNNSYSNKQSRAGAMCGLIEEFESSEKTKEFIREYSACPAEKVDDIDKVARSKKRLSARKGLENTVAIELNDEQRAIYDLPEDQNINVIAGAGSGKTRLLIYRALKLIYADGNKEHRILILAYNRAVRDEVEKRMDKYSKDIGSPNNDLRVYTFHGYASICIPELYNKKVSFDVWEKELLKDITEHKESYRNKYRHILIDEFQDITTTRLEIIKKLLELNDHCNAFVIGDMFQSIYGYEKKKDDKQSSIEPIYYYKQLEESFIVHNLTNNYRSYQAIINTAQMWFDNIGEQYKEWYKKYIPRLTSKLENDKFVQDTDDKGIIPCMQGQDWKGDLKEKILKPFFENRKIWTKENADPNKVNPFSSIGILFRTNSDVQDAFLWLKEQDFIKENKDIEVNILGSGIFYYCTREFYFFKERLEGIKETEDIYDTIQKIYNEMLKEGDIVYDKEVLDVAKDLSLYILNRNVGNNLTCKELAKEFKLFAKFEENHLKETLDRKQDVSGKLRIVLSTIHRVKGLEFDAVVIPASNCSIGFGNNNLSSEEVNMEERRLMYVAFSRAKRMLFWYKGDREKAILNNTEYKGQEGLVYADDGQSKVNQAYLAYKDDTENQYISKYVKTGDSIKIDKEGKIYHTDPDDNDHVIGILSKNNKIRSELEKQSDGFILTGFRVKSINIITKDQDDNYKNNNRIDSNSKIAKWCDNAEKQKYVYYVDYYGCVNIQE